MTDQNLSFVDALNEIWSILRDLTPEGLFEALKNLQTLDYSHTTRNGASVWKISTQALYGVAIPEPEDDTDFEDQHRRIEEALKGAGWRKTADGWNIPNGGDIRAAFVRGIRALRAL